jgi:hypothetical protein
MSEVALAVAEDQELRTRNFPPRIVIDRAPRASVREIKAALAIRSAPMRINPVTIPGPFDRPGTAPVI